METTPATLYETVKAQLNWVGSDLDSQTKYKLEMSKRFGVSIVDVETTIARAITDEAARINGPFWGMLAGQ